jgi:hypothetical protein
MSDTKKNMFVPRKVVINKEFLPQTPKSFYEYFLNDKLKSNPNLPLQKIIKFLENEWKKSPLNQKQKYFQLAKEDRERYVKEFHEARFKSFCNLMKSENNLKKMNDKMIN